MADGDLKSYFTARNCLMAAGIFIVLFAGWLRTTAAVDTLVYRPIRADTFQYYKVAYNLRVHGVYSHEINVVNGAEVTPQPDAFVMPGYPLFLALFVDSPPDMQVYSEITGNQALLATLAVLLVLLLFMPVTPWVALPAALLVAISPHLISASTYILSETLFSVLLLLSLLVLGLHTRGSRWYLPSLFAGGLLLGISALTRPVVELFPMAVIFVLWVSYDRRAALRGSAVLLLGVCLAWAPWIARNYVSLGRSGDPANMVQTLAIGMYPDLEYNHDPASHGQPGQLDPRYPEISKNLGSVLHEIGRRFREDTGEELRWYLIGKPAMLWSWHDVVGGPDVFLYPVIRSPYFQSMPFMFTHAVMYALHWPLVILALAGCLLAWLPQARRWMGAEPLFLARIMSLLLLYNTTVLMVLAPLVRYSIPFLPILYGMALTAVYLALRWLRSLRGDTAASGR